MLGCERFFLPILSDEHSCAGSPVSPESVVENSAGASAELVTARRWWELSDSLGEVVVE